MDSSKLSQSRMLLMLRIILPISLRILWMQISVCNIGPSLIYIFRQEMSGTFIFSLKVYQNLEEQNRSKTLATCTGCPVFVCLSCTSCVFIKDRRMEFAAYYSIFLWNLHCRKRNFRSSLCFRDTGCFWKCCTLGYSLYLGSALIYQNSENCF